MCKISKLSAFLFDAAVLIVVVGGLGLVCDLASANATATPAAAPAQVLGLR